MPAQVAMPARTVDCGVPGVNELTVEEGRAFFDEVARHTLNMSGEEFLAAWDRGQYQSDLDSYPGLVKLAMLIPFGR